ncbi:MAG: hypothetical protein AAGF55_14525 [Pseudomonadota bacterium]
MITLITRGYADVHSAKGIQQRFFRQGFKRNDVGVVSGEGIVRDRILYLLKRELVPEAALDSYADAVEKGAHLVIVRATFKPLMAIKKATETFETSGAMKLDIEPRFRVKPPVDHAPLVMKDHPRFFTPDPDGTHPEPFSNWFGWKMLAPNQQRYSAIAGGKLMLGGKVKTGRVANSAMSGTRFMSQKFWPMPLLSSKPRKLSVTQGHPFSEALNWPLTK